MWNETIVNLTIGAFPHRNICLIGIKLLIITVSNQKCIKMMAFYLNYLKLFKTFFSISTFLSLTRAQRQNDTTRDSLLKEHAHIPKDRLDRGPVGKRGREREEKGRKKKDKSKRAEVEYFAENCVLKFQVIGTGRPLSRSIRVKLLIRVRVMLAAMRRL